MYLSAEQQYRGIDLLSLQIDTFDDLINIVNTHPEWRRRLVKALFPEIDLPKALQELVESNRLMRAQLGDVEGILKRLDERQTRTEERQINMEERQVRSEERQSQMTTQLGDVVTRLDSGDARFDGVDRRFDGVDARFDSVDRRFDGVDARFDGVDRRFDRIETKLTNVERDVAALKGSSYENDVIKKAESIFGYGLRRGHDARNEIASKLEEAEEKGQISRDEYIQVMATDLLWSGRLKQSKEMTTLVIEASWFAEQNDLNRAIARTAILSRIGIQTFPVVAAKEWSEAIQKLAQEKHVIMVHEFSLNKTSLESMLAA